MIEARMVQDSISPQGVRLTTLSLVYPRFILAELNTHRMLSRNSASSRAIPTKKLIEQIQKEPARPISWGKNRPGMQASEELNNHDAWGALGLWVEACQEAIKAAQKLQELQVHKQVVNRILEPFMHAQTVVTATEWDNFYALRRHKDAQPEIKFLVDRMWEVMQESEPCLVPLGSYHTPYSEGDLDESVARCARVSYLTHEGKPTDRGADIKLSKRLSSSGHWSPFEHQATPIDRDKYSGNFRGWRQYREELKMHYDGFDSETQV